MMCVVAPSITKSRQFVDEVTCGDTRRALDALIERLAVELDQAEGARNVAALAKVLLDVFRAVEKLPKPSGRSLEDELRDRRTARGEVPVNRRGGRMKEEFPRRGPRRP